jgi:hypothetical protein
MAKLMELGYSIEATRDYYISKNSGVDETEYNQYANSGWSDEFMKEMLVTVETDGTIKMDGKTVSWDEYYEAFSDYAVHKEMTIGVTLSGAGNSVIQRLL